MLNTTTNSMKVQSRISSFAIALLIAISTLAYIVAAEPSAEKTASCSANGEGFSSTTCEEDPSATNAASINTPDKSDYHDHCHVWPPEGIPLEHTDKACNRAVQNAIWKVDDSAARNAPKAELIPDTVYLNLPEEKSWVCPLEDTGVHATGGGVQNFVNMNNNGVDGQATLGHPTRWVIHNRASTPIILTHVNALGLEVSAMDFKTFPAHSNTAVYPNGPIVLPGNMAVVEGRQGQMFIAREYREMLPMDMQEGEGGDIDHSWKSFKSALPSTLSFLPQQSRYETNKHVWHVLGRPGRVLMKHMMGNIFVRNQFGALCPEVSAGGSPPEENKIDRKGTPKDLNPDCNVLRKALINKVGCPVDIYWAPQNKIAGDTFNCEKFTNHLEPLEPFLAMDPQTRNVDGPKAPLKFENTYNAHNFVARMSHDSSLVARIELDHDIVRDCPEPKKSGAGVEVQVKEGILHGVAVDAMTSNETKSSSLYTSNEWVASANITAPPVIPRKLRKKDHDLLWQNRTGIISTSLPVAS